MSSSLFSSACPKKVRAIGATPSTASEKDVKDNTITFPIYMHWLAVSLYTAFEGYEEVDGVVSCKINGTEIKVDCTSLSRMVEQYKSVVQQRMDNNSFAELKMTAVIAVGSFLQVDLPNIWAVSINTPFMGTTMREVMCMSQHLIMISFH